MDKEEVKRVLAPYCPPLSPSQVEAIAEEIAKATSQPAAATTSIPESEAPAKAVSKKTSRKS